MADARSTVITKMFWKLFSLNISVLTTATVTMDNMCMQLKRSVSSGSS